ncbi:MAG: type 1 glutamine amidotransferase [Pseudomonadota bacterium]
MNKPLNICVFQHIACEHPGSFRDFAAAEGITLSPVELDEGEAIPELGQFDGLWVMGGPMDVWEEQQFPWLIEEKLAIREAIRRKLPFLGFCLGHQLLASALDGDVGVAAQPEVGIEKIALTENGKASPFLSGTPNTQNVLQWHSAAVLHAPQDAVVLARSPACEIQAMSIGDHALSMKYHVELIETTVKDWNEVPAYRESLEKSLGPAGAVAFENDTATHLGEMHQQAQRLFANWCATVFSK